MKYNINDKVIIIYDDFDYEISTIGQIDHLGYILENGMCFNPSGKGLLPFDSAKVEQLETFKHELNSLKEKQSAIIKGWNNEI